MSLARGSSARARGEAEGSAERGGAAGKSRAASESRSPPARLLPARPPLRPEPAPAQPSPARRGRAPAPARRWLRWQPEPRPARRGGLRRRRALPRLGEDRAAGAAAAAADGAAGLDRQCSSLARRTAEDAPPPPLLDSALPLLPCLLPPPSSDHVTAEPLPCRAAPSHGSEGAGQLQCSSAGEDARGRQDGGTGRGCGARISGLGPRGPCPRSPGTREWRRVGLRLPRGSLELPLALADLSRRCCRGPDPRPGRRALVEPGRDSPERDRARRLPSLRGKEPKETRRSRGARIQSGPRRTRQRPSPPRLEAQAGSRGRRPERCSIRRKPAHP